MVQRSRARTSPRRSPREYTRIADIATGGVGHVALAIKREGSFERLYAVKRLRAEHRDDEDFRTMFFDEARLAGFVRHANVVSVLDVGEDDDGPYLVMDYVEGVPLSAIIKHSQRSGTEVPLQVALRIVMEAARGLHAAHEVVGPEGTGLGLVHRDVSPQNILVGFDGVTRVTDFGVAKAFGRITQTVTGVLKGKLGYMAPEQLRFEPLDRRADIFALGVVLYELLVGARLYRSAEEYDGVRRILEEAPPDLGDKREDAPPKLVELVFSMLAKKKEQRPATAQAVAQLLDEVLSDVETVDGKIDVSQYVSEAFAVERELQSSRARIRPPDSLPPPPDQPRGSRLPWLAAAGVTAMILLAVAGLTLYGGSGQPTPGGSTAGGTTAEMPVETETASVTETATEIVTRTETQVAAEPEAVAPTEPEVVAGDEVVADTTPSTVGAPHASPREQPAEGSSRRRERRERHTPRQTPEGPPQWDWQ